MYMSFFKNQLLNNHSATDISLDLINVYCVLRILYVTFFPDTSKDTIPGDLRRNAMVREMAKQMGINTPIQVFVSNKNLEMTDECGGIYIPGFWNNRQLRISADEKRLNFVTYHELAHIKNQDSLITAIYLAVIIELLLLSLKRISLIYSLPLTIFAFMSLFYLRRYQEKRADLVAASFSNAKEIQEFIDHLEVYSQCDILRNTKKNLVTDLFMKLFTDGDRNISPLTSIFDTHPSWLERTKYLQPFVTQHSSASYYFKAFIKQSDHEDLKNISLSSEDHAYIQKEIDKSSKRDRYRKLKKIEILAYLDFANVRLFFSGEDPYFIPFDFDSSNLYGNASCLIEILQVILSQPSRNFYYKCIAENMPIPSAAALKEEFPDMMVHRCVFMVKDQHTKNQHYVIYPEEKPLSLEYKQLANYCV